MFKGDFGTSMRSGQPVTTMIWRRAPATLQLGLAAWLVSTLVGVSLGMHSASKRASIWDYIGRGLALIGQATPSFWLAILSIYIFAVYLEWLPVAGRGIDEGLGSRLKHMVLPVTVLSLDPLASYLRLTRSSMQEILDSKYIKLARAKGVGKWGVIFKHALRNALIQPLTVSALVLASFITGVLFVEQVFPWPGIGPVRRDLGSRHARSPASEVMAALRNSSRTLRSNSRFKWCNGGSSNQTTQHSRDASYAPGTEESDDAKWLGIESLRNVTV